MVLVTGKAVKEMLILELVVSQHMREGPSFKKGVAQPGSGRV
jgi:hypothetical protein